MKIKRTCLIDDLNKVMPGIATGTSIIDGADTVVFDEGHIYSYNSSISVDVTESSETGLKGVVKGVDFYNSLNKLVSDEIDIDVTEKEWIIRDGKIKVSMTLLPPGDIFKRFKSLKPNESWTDIDGEDFNRGLSICNMQKNISKYAGIYIKENTFMSTDAFQINTYKAANSYPECFLSNSAVTQLLKWKDFTQVEMNKMWIQFKSSNGTIFSVRSLAIENFPFEQISDALNGYNEFPVLTESSFTPEFYRAVERAAVFSKEDDGHEVIDIIINSTGCTIKSERTSGTYEENVEEIKSENGDFSFELDVDMIRACRSYFDVFKLMGNDEQKIIMLLKDSSCKVSSIVG